MNKKAEETLNEIEAAQAGLRESIETTKKLADQSEELLRRYRREIAID